MGYMRKFSDRYRGLPKETQYELEKNTDASANIAEWSIGYSTVPLYQDGQFAIPFEIRLTDTKQLTSRNTPVTDLIQIDASFFF